MISMVTHSLAGVSMASVSMAGKEEKPIEPVVPSNEIWYTTTDGAIITPYSTGGMPTLVSNTYDGEYGKMVFASNVTKTGNIFQAKTTLKQVWIPTSVTIINNSSFRGSALTTINIKEVKTIEGNAFLGCSSLVSVGTLSKVVTLGAGAFQNCTLLKSIDSLEILAAISESAFQGCSSLKSVGKTTNLKTIGNFAFRYCSALETIDLPFVESLGQGAFGNCTGLKSINLGRCKTIGVESFVSCSNLETIGGLTNAETIGQSAFQSCGKLSSILVFDKITNIGTYAFRYCRQVPSWWFNMTTPPTGTSNMLNDTGSTPIYVPSSAVADYKAASGWSTYASRIFPIP